MIGCIYAHFEAPETGVEELRSHLGGKVNVAAKIWRAARDEVSKMILGLHSSIRTAKIDCATEHRSTALTRVEDANCVLVLTGVNDSLDLATLRSICSSLCGVLLIEEEGRYVRAETPDVGRSGD